VIAFAVLAIAEGLLHVVALFGISLPGTRQGFDSRIDESIARKNVREISHNNILPSIAGEFRVFRNSAGFRGPEPCREHDPECGTKIVTIGGSTTNCRSVDDAATWTSLVGDELRRRTGKPVWINNAGFDGHSTRAHIRLLPEINRRVHPDIALFMIGLNDLGYYNPTRATVQPGLVEVTLKHPGEAPGLILPSMAQTAIMAAQMKFQPLSACSLDSLEPVPPTDQPAIEAGLIKEIPVFRERVATIGRQAVSMGITPVFVTQATLCGNATDPDTGVDLGRVPMISWSIERTIREHKGPVFDSAVVDCTAMYGPRCDTFARRLELFNDALRLVCRENSWVLIDLAASMPKASKDYLDSMHFSVQGNRKVADIIAAGIIESGLLDRVIPHQ
jgi:lysophospholipase L1-like esterase